MLQGGYVEIGRFMGTPVRVHWSMPIGLFVLTGFSFSPGAWIGFLLVLLVHEIGHAWVARSMGFLVVGIDVSAVGGACRWGGDATSRQRAIVAWGGVLGQAALLFVALPLSWIVPRMIFFGELIDVLIRTNLILAALNLLPMPPLDGAEAWRLFRGRR